MELLKKGETLFKGKTAVLLAGLGAPRITIVSDSIKDYNTILLPIRLFGKYAAKDGREES